MPVENLNHINIRAPHPLLEEVRDFYVEVIGLSEGDRPSIPIDGFWLYAGENAVVHLMDSAYRGMDENTLTAGTSHVDHFALTCSDIAGTEARLRELGAEFRRNDFTEYGFSQLFLTDPTGMGVELNFPHQPGSGS